MKKTKTTEQHSWFLKHQATFLAGVLSHQRRKKPALDVLSDKGSPTSNTVVSMSSTTVGQWKQDQLTEKHS